MLLDGAPAAVQKFIIRLPLPTRCIAGHGATVQHEVPSRRPSDHLHALQALWGPVQVPCCSLQARRVNDQPFNNTQRRPKHTNVDCKKDFLFAVNATP